MNDAIKRGAAPALILAAALWAGMSSAQAQQPAAGGAAPAGAARGGGRGPVLSVTSTSFPDGGEVPMHNAGRGDNKSPAFEFHWMNGTAAGDGARHGEDLRDRAPRHRELGPDARHHRHAALDGVQHSGHREGLA